MDDKPRCPQCGAYLSRETMPYSATGITINLDNKIVCLDLDGVLANYDKWRGPSHIGEPIPEGVALAKSLRAAGVGVCIFSCRLNGQWKGVDYAASKRTIEDWLDRNGVPYDQIATQLDGKPFADAYVDDRAVHFHPDDPDILANIIRVASVGWGETE